MPDDPRTLPPPLADPTGSPYVTFREAPGHIGQVIDFDHHQRTATVHWGTVDAAWTGHEARPVDKKHPWDDLTPVDYTPPGMVLIPVTDPVLEVGATGSDATGHTHPARGSMTAEGREHLEAQALKATPVEDLTPFDEPMAHEKGAEPGDPCPECAGSGVVAPEAPLEEGIGCQHCAGTGTVHKPTCPIWRGDFACTCLADGA